MKKLGFGKIACVAALLCVATTIPATAQTFDNIFTFDGRNGAGPWGALVQGFDGYFYGVTNYGNALDVNAGIVFTIGPNGRLKTLYNFCSHTNSSGVCLDGSYPSAGLVLAGNGDFYGTTTGGGSGTPDCMNDSGCGTVFQITPAGQLTTLYNFCSKTNCTDGVDPMAALVVGTNGNFYGTTLHGGSNAVCSNGCGTIFEITRGGQLTTLYAFCSDGSPCTDGANPTGLVRATDGSFYGTTQAGGTPDGYGTVFRITPAGEFTTLHTFCTRKHCTDGAYPNAALVQGANGNFYGSTTNNTGTIFEITPGGKLTTLHTFCSEPNCADGAVPDAPLMLATDGNFYGTTLFDGTGSAVFQMTPSGTVTTIFATCEGSAGCTGGNDPLAALLQATSGTFYGSMYGEADAGEYGTIYSLSMGLGPFVESNPNFAKVGSNIHILGNALTGATSVTFNGVPATFKVISDTYIQAMVPTGATSGTIEVITPSGTLSSNVAFQVLP
jgi:uncharacterized repeat protein (TIGR03803 family)